MSWLNSTVSSPEVRFPRGFVVPLALMTALLSSSSFSSDQLRVWISPGTYAYHFNRGKDLRDENVGFGAEIALSDSHVLMGGSYINSNSARSHYAGYQWRSLHWRAADIDISAGVAISAFDGYPGYRDGRWFLAPLPIVSVEGRYLGANFSIIPTLEDRLDGAFAIQLKLRVW